MTTEEFCFITAFNLAYTATKSPKTQLGAITYNKERYTLLETGLSVNAQHLMNLMFTLKDNRKTSVAQFSDNLSERQNRELKMNIRDIDDQISIVSKLVNQLIQYSLDNICFQKQAKIAIVENWKIAFLKE